MAETERPSGSNEEYSVTITEVNIADPGMAFILNLSRVQGRPWQAIPNGMVFRLVLTDTDHPQNMPVSELWIKSTTSDSRISVVMPFGDAAYQAGESFSYVLKVFFLNNSKQPITSGPNRPIELSGQHSGEAGIFEAIDIRFGLNPGDKLLPGQYLRSPDYSYFGYMSFDGCFRVLRGKPGEPGAVPRDATPTAGHGQMYLVYHTGGDISINYVSNNTMYRSAFPGGNVPAIGRLILADDGRMKIVNPTTGAVIFNVTDNSNLFHPPV